MYVYSSHLSPSQSFRLLNVPSAADDISMIFATAFVLHRAYSAGRSARWSRNFGGVIAAAFVAFAAYHAYTDELLVHGLLFGGMTAAVAVKTRALIRRVHEGDREKERRLKVAAKVGARKFSLLLSLFLSFFLSFFLSTAG